MTTVVSATSSATRAPSSSALFTRTGLLLRLAVRRERLLAVISVVVFALINSSTAASITSMYSTAEQRAGARTGLGGNAAFLFLLGPIDNTDSAAALTVWRAGLFMIAALAVCVVLLVVRQTRKEEELGRAEFVRAGATGPLASLAAASIAATAFSVVIALGMSVMLFPLGAGVIDVLAVFAQYASTGMAAAGVALVAAQIAKTSHIANLTASSVVILGYLLRGVADASGSWGGLRWISPMGWAESIDPFADNAVWWALPSLAVFVGGGILAGVLSRRRDIDAGLIAPRPGPAATSRLSSPEAVVARLTLPLLGSWVGALVVYGLVVGFMQPSVDELASGNSQFGDVVRQSGVDADLSTLFGITMMGFFAVAAGTWAVNVATRMRGEETRARTELLLATPTARGRYLLDHAALTGAGVVVILELAATALTLGNGIAGGDWSSAGGDAFRSATAQIPAALVMSSIMLALYAIRTALVPIGWLLVIVALFLGPLSGMFDLPQWAQDLSPYTHTPLVPVEPMVWTPAIVMLCLTVVFTALAWAAFRWRDIG
ncbi:ABC transporter permease [Gordonia sp. ABSL11-1]|uniref:ABC transporter permease n=1 Tax=Gordonia sp. ABSL11-1 TaxID=3053924 RepID=UPI00257233C2|nr:ABC transporter permease [Gordonia sp. ABSL11-1]MDL9948463.1 ABC transporter permease [Gordonia sp. ABSL11-1]